MSILTKEIVKGFAGSLLSRGFDGLKETPKFHEDLWELCCSPNRQVAIAAPRSHAKSTTVTHSFVLASVLFRDKSYVLIISNTESQSVQFLHDIKNELIENEDLKELFGVDSFIKDTETDVICKMTDGHLFRITAKGAEQKMRGLKWKGTRPNLIVCDDLEDDEQVMNQDRREKFRKWFYNAVLPSLSDNGQIRVVGTILHLDSLLERLMPSETAPDTVRLPLVSYSTNEYRAWASYRFRAHDPEYKHILWEEKFPISRLMAIKQDYHQQGFPEGYSQEYLNYPIDEGTAFFRKSDLRAMTEADWKKPKKYYAAIDFAISDRERADYTVIAVCGMDADGDMHLVDLYRDRMDSKQIIDAVFAIQKRWEPDIFTMEQGAINKSIGPFLRDEMHRRQIYLNVNTETPIKDKQSRARAIQGRLRAGTVRFDTESTWYPTFEEEMLVFPRGRHDDQVDALSWLGLTVDKFNLGPTEEELEDEDYEAEMKQYRNEYSGRSAITGY